MKKIYIIIILMIVGAVIGLERYVGSESFSAKIRPEIERAFAAAAGNHIRIGDVRAHIIPPFLTISDITVSDAQGDRLLTIKKCRAYVNPFPLLVKIVSIPEIVILDPDLVVERSAQGEFNFSGVIEQMRSKNIEHAKKEASPFHVVLRTVRIRRGRVSYRDKQTPSSRLPVVVSGLNLKAKIDLPDKITLQVRAGEVRNIISSYPELTARLKTGIVYEKNQFEIESLTLSAGDMDLKAAGAIGALPERNVKIKIESRIGPQTMERFLEDLYPFHRDRTSLANLSAEIDGSLSSPIVQGKVSVKKISFKDIHITEAGLSFGYKQKVFALDGKDWKLAYGSKPFKLDRISAYFLLRDQGAEINHFELSAGDFSVKVTGALDTKTGYDIALAAEATGRDPVLSTFVPLPLEGRLGLKGRITGGLAAPVFDGVISAWPLAINSVLFDEVGGKITYEDRMIVFSSIKFIQQGARLLLHSSIDLRKKAPVYDARMKIMQADSASIVSIFYKPLPIVSSISGDLIFSGTRHDFSGFGELTLDRGTAYGETFESGKFSVSVTPRRITFPQIHVRKGNTGIVKASGWIGFDKTYSAHLESSTVDLSEVNHVAQLMLYGPSELVIFSSGSFSDPVVKAHLTIPELSNSHISFGEFQADLAIRKGVLSIESSLGENGTTFIGDLALTAPFQWKTRAELNVQDIDPFLLLGKHDLMARAGLRVEGRIELSGTGADISTLNGVAFIKHFGLTIGDYKIENSREPSFTIARGQLQVKDLQFSGPGTSFTLSGNSRILKDMDFLVTGKANLSLLRLFYKEIEYGEGIADLELTVSDTWVDPELAGSLRIMNGELKVRDVPQKFSALNGSIEFDREGIIAEALKGEVGGGTLLASGGAQLKGLSLRDFSTNIAFENVTVRYPEGLTSTLSGTLTYDGNTEEQTLAGEVEIRRARYEKAVEWKSMLVDLGRGLHQKKKTDIGWIGTTQINIHFFGKDSITLQNNLAKMLLDVDFFLRGTVNQPQLVGRLEARKGFVYFRKNNFKVLNATADFIDPNRLNPVLDIQAETKVKEYQIRLALSGTADRSTLSFISIPPLSDVDILSLLALGKTTAELTGKESGVGMSEAASFATGQFQDIFEQRARSLTGLDRFQVDPALSKTEAAVPRITVGKEILRDKMFFTYSSNVGGTAPEQSFRLEYILDRHLSLQGERNETGNIGADLKFRFEFK